MYKIKNRAQVKIAANTSLPIRQLTHRWDIFTIVNISITNKMHILANICTIGIMQIWLNLIYSFIPLFIIGLYFWMLYDTYVNAKRNKGLWFVIVISFMWFGYIFFYLSKDRK
jgi:hypothetical protein